MVTLENIKNEIDSLKYTIEHAIMSARINPKQVTTVEGLSDINTSIGTIRAGEFLALSSGTSPTASNGTGTFISALGRTFGTKTYHIGGVDDGDLKWGANSLTGELEAGDGATLLTANGLSIYDGTTEVARLGNLNEFLGISTDLYGFAIGDSAHYLIYDQTDGLRVVGMEIEEREILTANRTYYVRADGSDYNTGLGNSAEEAFATIQHAIDTAAYLLDTRQYNITIAISDGTYTLSSAIRFRNLLGTGSVTITGNLINPQNVILIATTYAVIASRVNVTQYTLQGMKIQASTAIYSSHGSYIRVGNLIFEDTGSASYAHLLALWRGTIEIINPYQISGDSSYHYRVLEGGYIFYDGDVTPELDVTVDANLSIGLFASCAIMSSLYVPYINFIETAPTVVGKKYECNFISHIGTASAGANYFPGDSAGSVASYGVYD